MDNIVFANPGFLYLFIVIALMITWYVLSGRKATASITVSGCFKVGSP